MGRPHRHRDRIQTLHSLYYNLNKSPGYPEFLKYSISSSELSQISTKLYNFIARKANFKFPSFFSILIKETINIDSDFSRFYNRSLKTF